MAESRGYPDNKKVAWHNIQSLPSHTFTCGHCGNPIASNMGWQGQDRAKNNKAYIYMCHYCGRPTFFDLSGKQTGKQIPGIAYGNSVKHISDTDVADLYEEARNCTSANAFTAAVLCCRKLLMHIAVSKGAQKNQTFFKYVEFLSENNYIPPGAKQWVDHIRTKGNEANHEITIMKRKDAEDLLTFIGMLLKIIYEFPAVIDKKITDTDKQQEGNST